MRACLRLLPLLVLLAACGGDGGTGPDDGGGSNRLPQASIGTGGIALPRAFLPGETVVLTATSTDPDGDDLTHRWTLSGSAPGTLSADSGEQVTWTAGATPGSALISLVSNDGKADSPTSANLNLVTGTQVAGGDVANATIWSRANSPYVVTHDIRVPAGSTLEVEAGVEVFFRGTPTGGGSYNTPDFLVEGVFSPRGANNSSSGAVRLRGGRNIEAMQWSGLTFRAASPSESRLSYCRIEEAETGLNVGGTGPVFLFGGRIEKNATGVAITDPDGTGPGQGIVSTASIRGVVVAQNLGIGVLINSSTLNLRQCTIRDNAGIGLSVGTATDPAVADVDSCRFDSNGGSLGSNVAFSNSSSGGFFPLTVQVSHSNFGVDAVDAPNNVSWGGCAPYPVFFQQFSLTGNFWGVTVNNQSGLSQILATMSGYSGCVDDPSAWMLANGDWVISAHNTGAP